MDRDQTVAFILNIIEVHKDDATTLCKALELAFTMGQLFAVAEEKARLEALTNGASNEGHSRS